jgi:anti-sigma factor RsiW
MTTCPSSDELLLLLDGEVTENRAAELRAHLAACSACARELRAQEALVAHLGAPVPGAPSPGAVDAVMARIARREAAVPRRRWRIALPALALGAAAAVVAVVALRPGPPGSDALRAPGFEARGGAAPGWERSVGVELWVAGPPAHRLTEGARVTGATAYAASYRNLTGEAVHLLAFAVDAAGEVHWLYPAYLAPGSDPAAVVLPPSREPSPLPDAVALEGVPAGALRLLTVLSPRPVTVSQVERLGPPALEPAELRRRFPGSRVDLLRVQVDPPAAPR